MSIRRGCLRSLRITGSVASLRYGFRERPADRRKDFLCCHSQAASLTDKASARWSNLSKEVLLRRTRRHHHYDSGSSTGGKKPGVAQLQHRLVGCGGRNSQLLSQYSDRREILTVHQLARENRSLDRFHNLIVDRESTMHFKNKRKLHLDQVFNCNSRAVIIDE